jgi:hypothetical protein
VAALEQRLADGHADRVAIGLEVARPDAWGVADAGGGGGPGALIETVERRLRELGAGELDVDALLGKNLLARAARAET